MLLMNVQVIFCSFLCFTGIHCKTARRRSPVSPSSVGSLAANLTLVKGNGKVDHTPLRDRGWVLFQALSP